jgi:hypothetical protein
LLRSALSVCHNRIRLDTLVPQSTLYTSKYSFLCCWTCYYLTFKEWRVHRNITQHQSGGAILPLTRKPIMQGSTRRSSQTVKDTSMVELESQPSAEPGRRVIGSIATSRAEGYRPTILPISSVAQTVIDGGSAHTTQEQPEVLDTPPSHRLEHRNRHRTPRPPRPIPSETRGSVPDGGNANPMNPTVDPITIMARNARPLFPQQPVPTPVQSRPLPPTSTPLPSDPIHSLQPLSPTAPTLPQRSDTAMLPQQVRGSDTAPPSNHDWVIGRQVGVVWRALIAEGGYGEVHSVKHKGPGYWLISQ